MFILCSVIPGVECSSVLINLVSISRDNEYFFPLEFTQLFLLLKWNFALHLAFANIFLLLNFRPIKIYYFSPRQQTVVPGFTSKGTES
jgi:hypothetical protein